MKHMVNGNAPPRTSRVEATQDEFDRNAAQDWERSAALRAEFSSQEAYASYMRATASGQARIFSHSTTTVAIGAPQ